MQIEKRQGLLKKCKSLTGIDPVEQMDWVEAAMLAHKKLGYDVKVNESNSFIINKRDRKIVVLIVADATHDDVMNAQTVMNARKCDFYSIYYYGNNKTDDREVRHISKLFNRAQKEDKI